MPKTLLEEFKKQYGVRQIAQTAGSGSFTCRPQKPVTIKEAFQYCERLAKSHYENFTVGSFLIPKTQRQHIYNVYAFCRWADDLGDESAGPEEAANLLNWWGNELEACYRGETTHPVFIALHKTVTQYRLSMKLFKDLIKAFTSDQTKTRYETFEELCEYSSYSANPVGRIYLQLFGYNDEERFSLSDATCTALQLTNFWQDITVDWEKGRVYLPQAELRKAGYTERDLAERKFTPAFKECMARLVSRTRNLFYKGLPLVKTIDKKIRLDIELFTRGGLAILDKIETQGYDVLSKRPSVRKWTKLGIILARLLGISAKIPTPITKQL